MADDVSYTIINDISGEQDAVASALAPASSFDSGDVGQLWNANSFIGDSAEEVYDASGFAVLWSTDSNNNSITFNTTELVVASANGILLRTLAPLQDGTTMTTATTTLMSNISDPFEPSEVHENNYWGLLALFLVFATAAGNILVCLAICLERRLHNVTNYFLMSLAITDLMVAVLVMPLGILTLVKGE
ncbi:dopamine D2-like receptor [Anastrepha ludens]|uniref:dopamine D2-like receptor n=1 Tax=Anastrepha ludens TaxID=28586 RepID=UPI0023B1FA6C|nr:dopamine D2-like receptor [Anastrepha ludens]